MMKSLKWVALVAFLPTMASAAIRNSRHDLSSSSTATTKGTLNQICIYCHTPHKALQTNLLWNHTATAVTIWSWNATNGKTTGGTTLPTQASALSTRCLACHDGTIALGSVNNPGGGGAPATVGGLTGTIGSAYQIGAGGNFTGHHPVGLPYAGETGTYNGVVGSKAVINSTTDYSPVNATVGYCTSSTNICVTSSVVADGKNISIYNVSGVNGIECMSCHDVHNENVQSYFLKVTINASAICLTCHNK